MLGTAYTLTREAIGALERCHAIEVTAIGYRSEHDTRIEMTSQEQRQLAWEELPEEVRAERTAEAQAEHAELAARYEAHRAAERAGPELGL